MKWVRKHVKHGSRLALLALVVQFALSFGHFHALAAQTAPAIQASVAQADPAREAVAAQQAGKSAREQLPSNPDRDHPADACAICAVISLAGAALSATPPVLLLPPATQLRQRAIDVAVLRLNPLRSPFQSRAPPLS